MNVRKKLVIIGAGGYAKSVLSALDYSQYKLIGFLDQFSKRKSHLGYPIIAHELKEIENKSEYVYFIAVGNNEHRKRWWDILKENQCTLINVIDKTALISDRANIGTGNFVGKLSIINADAEIGDNCILNTRSLVEHGCKVRSHTNISTNTVLNGDVLVGEGSFIGSCTVVIGQRTIGAWSTIGAGSVVICDIAAKLTYAGVPAKQIIHKNKLVVEEGLRQKDLDCSFFGGGYNLKPATLMRKVS